MLIIVFIFIKYYLKYFQSVNCYAYWILDIFLQKIKWFFAIFIYRGPYIQGVKMTASIITVRAEYVVWKIRPEDNILVKKRIFSYTFSKNTKY